MRFLFNSVMVLGGFAGALIGFLGDVTVVSPFDMLNGLNVSLMLGVFGIVVCIHGLVNLLAG